MRCIAIDDEPMALSIIEQYFKRLGGVELTTYSDPIMGIEQVRRCNPDLLLLDIEMGVMSGVELARDLPEGVHLVFTTAYSQYAIDGFDLNAVDFLHKPYSYTRFQRAIEKVRQIAARSESESSESITVKVEYQSVNIPISAVQYVEAMDNYVKIYLSNARPVLSQMSMKSIEELLPKDRFARVHKSYVVSRKSVISYSRSQISLRYNDKSLPIGRTYLPDFLAWIKGEEVL